jgi:hypothetical protein
MLHNNEVPINLKAAALKIQVKKSQQRFACKQKNQT